MVNDIANLSDMDWVRAALSNAVIEGLTLNDVAECARHAASPERFDSAVNELARMTVG